MANMSGDQAQEMERMVDKLEAMVIAHLKLCKLYKSGLKNSASASGASARASASARARVQQCSRPRPTYYYTATHPDQGASTPMQKASESSSSRARTGK